MAPKLLSFAQTITDLVVDADNALLDTLGLKKGSYQKVDAQTHAAILSKLQHYPSYRTFGGSAANSAFAFRSLGGECRYLTFTGNDTAGDDSITALKKLGVEVTIKSIEDCPTGLCIVLVTPDGDRTMVTHQGAAARMTPDSVLPLVDRHCDAALIEGYMLMLRGWDAERIREIRDRSGCMLCLSLSAESVVRQIKHNIIAAADSVSILFGNESEYCALAELESPEKSIKALSIAFNHLVCTSGPNGSFVTLYGKTSHIPAFEASVVDTTGAGDMFAAAYIFGILSRLDPETAARAASYCAKKVIEQKGPRLAEPIRDQWESIVRG